MDFSVLNDEFSPPDISEDEARSVLSRYYGLSGSLAPLEGERDRNFKVTAQDGRQFVLKISGLAESREAIDFQVATLAHIERTAPDIGVPRGVPNNDGELYFDHQFDGGNCHMLRLVTYVSGEPVPTDTIRDSQTAVQLGHLQGRLCRALSSFFHPAAQRPMPWNISNGLMFDDTLLADLEPDIEKALAPHLKRLQVESFPTLLQMRSQVIHNDAHTGNVLVNETGAVSGLIDFGDAVFAPLIQDLAVSATGLADYCPEDPYGAMDQLVRGFEMAFPLLPDEREILRDATIMRSLMCVTLGGYKMHRQPESAVLRRIYEASRRGLLALLSNRDSNMHPMPSTDDTLRRRRAVMSPTYKYFYDEPLHIVRGSGTRLYDTDGRQYLDCYNNVPSVGHAHPHVVAALERQAATLNTHTRYLHHEIVRYAERISATLPDELDTCMFVCTGTEANDLAYTIARTVTGKTGAVVSLGAYHGNSIGIADVSIDGAEDSYPPHVKPIALPDTYRGPYGPDEPDIGKKLAALADQPINEMAASPHGLAMLMIDGIFDAPGIFTAPPRYLSELFARVHRSGGLVVADEVQSGLCRLGDNYWSFQDTGAVPDIVTMGKPMGAGHPLGIVAAKRSVLEEFAARRGYFNTFGGNPVSAAVGNAVLDVIESENVLGKVHDVGQYLMSGLARLAGRHEIIGDIRGKGFFLGLDLVADRETRKPHSKAAHNLANRLRHRGVLVSVNGAHDNVIKIRPPLVFSKADADELLGAIDAEIAHIR